MQYKAPEAGELFYFGFTVDKFAPHKAGRILGLFEMHLAPGKPKKCFRILYPDGELGHAEFVEESQGSYELLNAEDGEAKHGEDAFK